MPLFNLLAVDNFEATRSIAPRDIASGAITTVRDLDEKEEIELWMQAILHDTNRTSHGPSEIVDIFTHKLSVRGKTGLAAFILKGKSFPTVRPVHVSHQIFRLERLQGLSFAILGASGNVLDEVKEQFVSTAKRLLCDYAILDAQDLAYQRAVALLHAVAQEAGRNLGVEHVLDVGRPRALEDGDVLAAGVHHHLDRRVGQGDGQGAVVEVPLDRVEDLGPHAVGRVRIGDRELGKAEHRLVAALGHELRVDGQSARVGRAPRELGGHARESIG